MHAYCFQYLQTARTTAHITSSLSTRHNPRCSDHPRPGRHKYGAPSSSPIGPDGHCIAFLVPRRFDVTMVSCTVSNTGLWCTTCVWTARLPLPKGPLNSPSSEACTPQGSGEAITK